MTTHQNELFRKSSDQATQAEAAGYRLPITLDTLSICTLVALLQLAGRHPGLPVGQKRFQLTTVAKLLECLRKDGYNDIAAFLELGNDPANDHLVF